MKMLIYPKIENPTDDKIKKFRQKILDSLVEDSTTWAKLERKINLKDNVELPLFTHIKEQFKNEPFYFRFGDDYVSLNFERNKDKNSKSMIIGMLTYYLIYNLNDIVEKIEIK
ncbi:hypothetical protein QWZ06_08935 [Chryseobacterium tructae]|uniref:Phage protein n=1 Tax=Chryseobacterium tructae TaxID=1037380 RepID=A0ABV7XWE5_9FLAO|nr:hypothetical protein [Chryseobacterium tructae]MDN3692382.1 hypothetical protein [Chryseobacterium tructae]